MFQGRLKSAFTARFQHGKYNYTKQYNLDDLIWPDLFPHSVMKSIVSVEFFFLIELKSIYDSLTEKQTKFEKRHKTVNSSVQFV